MRLLILRRADEPYAIRAPEVIFHRPDEFSSIKRFKTDVEIAPAEKKMDVIKNAEGQVVDYRNVQIRGYLSTFKSVTEADRQGDYVDEGAFRETIAKFMKNPVMLTNHRNAVENIAGNFTKMTEDKNGLAFEATLSNSPANIDARFKVAEGHLKTTSMGGVFHYKEDGRGIFKVDLWEGSLVAIPANPDARFTIRSLNETEKKFIKSGAGDWYSFLERERLQTMRE